MQAPHNRMIKSCLVLTSVFLAVSCGTPKIDTTNDETTKATIDKVRSSLSGAQLTKFEDSLKIVMFNTALSGGLLNAQANIDAAKKQLNGKTAEQIIADADKIKIEREAKEKEQALQEIEDLTNQKNKADSDAQQLKKFQVITSRFTKIKKEFSGEEPIIELTVKNLTESAISAVAFEGMITSRERSVPWLKENFSYKISGGLEPGEVAEWTLAPNRFSEWGKVEAPADATFTVKAIGLKGGDGEVLYSSEFSEEKLKRLEALSAKYK